VAVTTFASNVARIRSVANAARSAGRKVIVVGRAMYRVIEAAQETGYLDPDLPINEESEFDKIPPRKVVALCTGSQGEARAAMARIAQNEHPNVELEAGEDDARGALERGRDRDRRTCERLPTALRPRQAGYPTPGARRA
jgi:ribonuclease J